MYERLTWNFLKLKIENSFNLFQFEVFLFVCWFLLNNMVIKWKIDKSIKWEENSNEM